MEYRVALSLLALTACCVVPANGQSAVKAEDAYVVLSYFQVAQENQTAYEQLLTTTSKKFYTELMNQPGSNMIAWNASRIMYRGIHGNPATHVSAIVYNGPPPGGDNVALMEKLMRQASGLEPAEYRNKLNGLRKQLGTELVRGIAWTQGATTEGAYRVVTYSKAETGKLAAIREMTRNVWLPVYAAAAHNGKVLGWSAWSYVFPRGGEAPYDLLNATMYKDLAAAVAGYLPSGAEFEKIHPATGYISAVDELRGARKTGIVLVSRILTAIAKPVARQ
jgi:hypothetical protein